jgi:hypothetical protein
MSKLPLVAVVIVNYNGYQLTRDCLRSFEPVSYGNYALIVVDNASVDGSVPRLREEFPHVHYVEHKSNAGFTGGNNLGIRKACELGAEYLFLLNNDTVVSENVLQELVGFAVAHPETGIIAPLTYYFEAKDTISFGGGQIDRNTGLYYHLNKGKKLRDLLDNVIDCTFIEGTAMFLRTEVALEGGGFCNKYFLTSEESELCVRVADKGYRLAMISSCSVWHKISQSLKGGSTLRDYFIFRNRLLFVKRNARNFSAKNALFLIGSYAKCFASAIRGDSLPTAMGIVLGVLDYFAGVTGPGRYAKRLNASCEDASLSSK